MNNDTQFYTINKKLNDLDNQLNAATQFINNLQSDIIKLETPSQAAVDLSLLKHSLTEIASSLHSQQCSYSSVDERLQTLEFELNSLLVKCNAKTNSVATDRAILD